MRRWIALALLLAACERRSPDHQPVVVGATAAPGAAQLSEMVAQKLESAECRVERRFSLGSTAAVDAQLVKGEIDVYVESHRTAIREVQHRDPGEPPDNESKVRAAWIKRDLVWAPILGVEDFAPVFRKDIDGKCRSASRTLMRMAYAADPAAVTR